MVFNKSGFIFTTIATQNMADRARATQLSLLGGMMGSPLAGVLLATVAGQEQGRPPAGVLGPGTPAGGRPPEPVPGSVEVPDVPDDPEQAERVLRTRGLVPVLRLVESNDPKGEAFECDPPPKTVVARGSTVRVFVSAGLRVPDVVDEEADEAEALLKAAGFDAVEREESAKTGKEGVVESQEPAAGEFVDVDTVIRLKVFTGRRLQSAGASRRKA
jgi:hypothetical protein